MANVLRNLITRAPAHPDLMVALMLLLAIGMMIMPIPIVVIDMLIGFNLALPYCCSWSPCISTRHSTFRRCRASS